MPGEPYRVTPAEPLAGVLAEARRRAEAGDLTGARSALEVGLAAAEADLGQFHPDLTHAMVDLATIARELGNLTEAQRQLGRAHRILLASVGRDHVRTLSVEDRLARVNVDLGDPTDDLDRHLADAGPRLLGEDSAAVRDARARLGAASASSAWGTPLPPGGEPFPPGTEPAAQAQPGAAQAQPGAAQAQSGAAQAQPAAAQAERGAASAWADAGEWSDPTGWSGAGWTSTAGSEPYAPVPGAPGVFGLRPPAAGGAGQGSAPRSVSPIPPDAPLYVPEEYDSGGWAAPASDEATHPQSWGPPAPGGPRSWEPPAWEEPPRSRGRRVVMILLSVAGIVALTAGTVVAMQALPPSATGVKPPRVVTVAPSAPAAAPSSAPAPTSKARTSAPAPTTGAGGVGAPPTRLRLTDDGTSVTVTWRDPSDGTVPFIVAGARSGDESHPMQSIPAGRTRSTIHGLNTRYDYCFTVAAVYSIDVVARSTQVCTHRLSTADTP
ncbi:hypothetical protein [Luedemannella helvata]